MTSASPSRKGPGSVQLPRRCEPLPRDPRGYPIIATVGREGNVVDFGALSEKRKLVLATFDLCAVCGTPFHAEEGRWQVGFVEPLAGQSDVTSNEAPVHGICALYSAQVCPFVSSPYARFGDDIRRGQQRSEAVYLVEYERTEAVYGRRSGLQTNTAVLHFDMAGRRSSLRLQAASEAVEAYEYALEADEDPALDASEQALRDLVNNPEPEHAEDSGGVMGGAAWYIGAAFCPGVREVQGMELYTENPEYTMIARRVVAHGDTAVRSLGESDDAATRATMQWFRTRTDLPEVLRQWCARGKRLAGTDSRGSYSGSDAAARKSRRKSAAASRRKNRRS